MTNGKSKPKQQVVKVTTTTVKPNKKRGPRPKKSIDKRQLQFKKAKRQSKANVKFNANAEVRKRGQEVSREARSVALSALLPYEGPMVRLRDGVQKVPKSTAVTRHFEFEDVNSKALLMTNGQPGLLPGGSRVYSETTQSMCIVSILDPYLHAIVPRRWAGSAEEAPKYQCTTFMNPNQSEVGKFKIRKPNNHTPLEGQTMMYIDGNENNIMWFDMVEFEAIGGKTEDTYGALHACFDAEDGRYVWLDARDPVAAITQDSNVFISWSIPAGWQTSNPMGEMNGSSIRLVAKRMDDETTNTSTVENIAVPQHGSNVHSDVGSGYYFPVYSGYYKFGISGFYVSNNGPTSEDLYLSSMQLTYTVGTDVNYVARHIINKNIFANDGVDKKTFFRETQVTSGSMLVQNVTPKLFQGGKMFAISNSTPMPWYFYTGNHSNIKDINGSTNEVLRYVGDAKNGCYGWLRNQDAFDFRKCTDTIDYLGGGQQSCIRSWAISRQGVLSKTRMSGMNIYLIEPPLDTLEAMGTAPSMTINLLSTVQFEYTSMNQTPVLSTLAYDSSAIDEAFTFLGRVPTFSENPLHISSMANAVKNMFGAAVNYYKGSRKMMQPIYGALAAFGGPVLGTIGRVATAVDAALF